jgi:mRNA interferase MazF
VPDPGDVVTVDFVGATGIKRRPAVVVSSALYHQHRPDLVLGVLTTQTGAATTPLDYILQDWDSAGLHRPSAFRAYFGMAIPTAVQVIGHLSARDWQGVQACLARTLAIPSPSAAAPPAPGA